MNQADRNAVYIRHGSLAELQAQLFRLSNDRACQGILFLMACENSYTPSELAPALKTCSKPIAGGIFPELICQGQRKASGVLLIPLPVPLTIQVIPKEITQHGLNHLLDTSFQNTTSVPGTLFVFFDAMNTNKELVMDGLFNYFGITLNYLGGGTGSLQFAPFPSLICNEGVVSAAALVGWAPLETFIGVAHGWEAISDPLKVTESNGNEIFSLNWKPAFEVYKNLIEAHANLKPTSDNFFQIAKSYPLGVSKMDAEMVVRDPYKVSGNTIHVIDSVTEGEYVHILHGNADSLLAGARQARDKAISLKNTQLSPESIFCIDCISRALYMENDFGKELDTLSQGSNLYGMLPIGEVANCGDSYTELYNKTVVVCLW